MKNTKKKPVELTENETTDVSGGIKKGLKYQSPQEPGNIKTFDKLLDKSFVEARDHAKKK